ncbi:leucine-rich repeat-containing protein 34 [Grus japonensis]|uniref:Leucine-rich repeat-containing protein 34 n=1 Tax=Grus japonensis TaxID=30415 RepID=A0ABC9X840_GRUJA
MVTLLGCRNDAVTLCFVFQQVMSVHPDLHQHYVRTCQNLGQSENPFIAHVLQEAEKNYKMGRTKGITLKIAGNNRLVPVQRVTDDNLQVLTSVLQNTGFVTDVLGKKVSLLSALFVLKENSTLQYLNLMFNDIGTSGAELIARALHRNETLVYLRMTGNKIGNKGGMFFASMLQINSTLEKLDLGDCDMEETTIHVALMLKKNSSLVELHLCKHEMKNFGVERLCEALYENSSLRYLDLSWLSVVSNNISGKGLVALSDAMKTNTELSYIYIWGNKFDEATCMAFSELIQTGHLKPNCTDVEPYEVDGCIHLAELSHGLKKHYYWTPSCGEATNKDANASLAIVAVSEFL